MRSALNENLNADIPLTVSSKDDLQGLSVRLAPAAVFAQAGMERSPLLSSLKFELQPDASGRQYIKVTSDQPVREPLLNFLVELEWAQGKLVREFAVFLDPPQAVLRHNGAPPLLAANPVNRSAIAAAPAARVAESMKFTGETYGPVSPGETLWSIAKLVKPAQVSTQQMMQALLRANPSAFNAPRVDALRAGAMLRIPDLGGGKAKPASASQVAANTPASPATPAKPETTAAEAAPRVRLLPPE
ncbi:MAG TPA: FimV/HubP family polar landmark protein, partial [Candidatus Competibacteraceae bacterium]|nr:FimV/HubP family polar landmark protein [Candidatus Competibacteraceae bacterium]